MFKYFKSNKKAFIILCVFLPLSVFIDVALASLLEKITDYGSVGNIQGLKTMMYVSLAYLPLSGVADFYYRYSMVNVLSSASDKLRKDIYAKIFSNDISYNKLDSSQHISTITNDVSDLESYYFKNICFFFHEFFYFSTSIFLLLNINIEITLTILVFAFFQLIVPIFFEKKVQNTQTEIVDIRATYIFVLKEHLENFNIIKLYRKGKFFNHKHEEASENWKSKLVEIEKIKKLMYEISFLAANGMYLGTVIIGFYLVYLNKMTIGQVIAASQLMAYVSRPLLSVNEIIASNQSAKPIKKKLEEILDTNVSSKNKEDLNDEIKSISFKNLSFSYDNKTILKHSNVEFDKGKKYLIIGESGSGKSTIFKLLQGQLTEYEGKILVNNTDLRDINLDSYYKKIGFCPQINRLFSTSIRENILLGDPKTYDQDLEQIIQNLDLETLEGKRDANNELSIGQKQRVNIARILYHDFEYLCYDEVTASIDYKNRKQIENLLLNTDKTILYITHNYNRDLIEFFDHILYVNQGEVSFLDKNDLPNINIG
ncbi:MAG: ABC transporter ATP-binding protein [Bacillota bacterium]|nr:ABC transporter ATP-binding protein [Bacillota bacterium]